MDHASERLVFIDETWTATNMPRSYGRYCRNKRLRKSHPHGHRKTPMFIAGLRMTGIVAPNHSAVIGASRTIGVVMPVSLSASTKVIVFH